jgi:hypothetical protein
MIKAYQVALFLFAMNTGIMMLDQVPLFGSAFMGESLVTNMSQDNFTYTFNSSMNNYEVAYDDQLLNTTNFSGYQSASLDEFGILQALTMFISAIYNSTLYLPWFLQSLGIPEPIIVFIVAPVWFVYGAGIFQIVRGIIIED